jgi:hypothetical protein
MYGLDENANVVEETFPADHQLGEFALDVDQDEAAIIDCGHPFALVSVSAVRLVRGVQDDRQRR